jgi:hypothetical protein
MIKITAGERTTRSVAGNVKKINTSASTRLDLASQISTTPMSIQTMAIASTTTPSGIPRMLGGSANIGPKYVGEATVATISTHNGVNAEILAGTRERDLEGASRMGCGVVVDDVIASSPFGRPVGPIAGIVTLYRAATAASS